MSSTMSDVQKIVVSLSTPEVVLEPGSTTQLVITVTNQQEASDRLAFEVEGIDVEWYFIPVPAVNVAPGAQASERILFKIGRSSENRAGSYPFLVRVQAMETGETGVAQATLVVKPFSALQVELNPKRAVATFLHPLNDFDVTVSNLGNHEETLDLFATDPEDGCAYEYDTDRITLKPGQSQVVPLAIRPKVTPLLGSLRLYGFSASARAVEDSYVSANAHGQIERHALINPLLGIFLLLLALGTGGFFVFRPHPVPPVVINRFDAQPRTVREGDSVTLSWDAANYNQIFIQSRSKGDSDFVNLPTQLTTPVGSVAVTPKVPQTTYRFVARGKSGNDARLSDVTIEVRPGPPPPPLKITTFYADPPIIHQGETSLLTWKSSGQNEFVLEPGITPAPKKFEETRQVTPDKDTTFTLKAVGKDDKVAAASVKVTVVPKDQCIAKIDKFAAPKGDVFIGDKVRLKWNILYARSAKIDAAPGPSLGEVRAGSGSVDIVVNEETLFTLTAIDSLGNTVTKTLTITPKPRPISPTPDATTNPDNKTILPDTGQPPAPDTKP